MFYLFLLERKVTRKEMVDKKIADQFEIEADDQM